MTGVGAGGRTGTGGSVLGAGGSAGGAGGSGQPGIGGSGQPGTGGSGQPGTGGGTIGVGGRGVGGAGMGTGGMGIGGAIVMPGTGGAIVIPPARLTTATASHDFGNVLVTVASATFSWVIRNDGGVTSGPLNLATTDPTQLIVTNGCTSALAPNASCTVVVTFKPATTGARSGTLTVSASPGGSVSLSSTANGQVQVTVTATGTGVVTSTPAGISCPGTCSAAFSVASVNLGARTTNGSGAFFSGWTGACASLGLRHDCQVPLTQSTATVGATFSPMTANLVFVTSGQTTPNLGNVAGYDKFCNDAASAAGINDGAGSAYVSFTSSTTSDVITRLAGASGWMTLDNKPFANTLASLFGSSQVFNSVRFDELGDDVTGLSYITGSLTTGAVNSGRNCTNWTGVGTAIGGYADAGPIHWVQQANFDCVTPVNLLCMGKTKTVTITPPAPTGRKVWLSNVGFTPNATAGMTPDARCHADRPAGVTAGVALISTASRAASLALVPTTSYYRPDGIFVGLGADLAAGTILQSGIWQSGDGVYRQAVSDWIWTGSPSPNQVGTVASTCGNWTDSTQPAGILGESSIRPSTWWSGPGNQITCTLGLLLYCVQTSP